MCFAWATGKPSSDPGKKDEFNPLEVLRALDSGYTKYMVELKSQDEPSGPSGAGSKRKGRDLELYQQKRDIDWEPYGMVDWKSVADASFTLKKCGC